MTMTGLLMRVIHSSILQNNSKPLKLIYFLLRPTVQQFQVFSNVLVTPFRFI